MILAYLSKISCLSMCGLIPGVSDMLHWSVSIFVQCQAVVIFNVLQYGMKSVIVMLPALFFLLKIVFVIQSLVFPNES